MKARLHEELAALKARRDPQRTRLVFGTGKGRKESASNVGRRLLANAVKRANERLVEADSATLPERLRALVEGSGREARGARKNVRVVA